MDLLDKLLLPVLTPIVISYGFGQYDEETMKHLLKTCPNHLITALREIFPFNQGKKCEINISDPILYNLVVPYFGTNYSLIHDGLKIGSEFFFMKIFSFSCSSDEFIDIFNSYVENGNIEIIKILIENANLEKFKLILYENCMKCVRENNLELFKLLSTDFVDELGSFLDVSIRYGRINFVKYILDRIIHVNAEIYIDINQIIKTSQESKNEIAKLLLKYAYSEEDNDYLLERLIISFNFDVVKYFIENYNVNINYSHLLNSLKIEFKELAIYLLQKIPKFTMFEILKALHVAKQKGYTDIVEMLQKKLIE